MNTLPARQLKVTSRAAVAAAAFLLAQAGLAVPPVVRARGKASIDFPFVARGIQCPAGSYDFESDGDKITLRSTDPKGPTVLMLVLTRLDRHEKDKAPEFVFDKLADRMNLSEIWLSAEDGYMVLMSPATRGSRVVDGSRPRTSAAATIAARP
jgi:hypothetical protein